MDRRVTPPKLVTSPSWGPPPPCKQALTFSIKRAVLQKRQRNVQKCVMHVQSCCFVNVFCKTRESDVIQVTQASRGRACSMETVVRSGFSPFEA